MKTNLIFLLKSVLLSTLGASVLSGLIMGIAEWIQNSAHPHQIWPAWLVGAVFGAMGGAIVSLVVSIIMIIRHSNNVVQCAIISTALVSALILFFFTFPL